MDDGHDRPAEDAAAAEAAVRTIADWLMANGITGWLIDGLPKPGDPIELQLYPENRHHQSGIEAHFGATVTVTIAPENALRYAPLTPPPPNPPRPNPEP